MRSLHALVALASALCAGGVPVVLSPEDIGLMEEIQKVAEEAALRASNLVVEHLGADAVSTKSNMHDLLTEIDPKAQEIIRAYVQTIFPKHGFLGEEDVEPGVDAAKNAITKAMSNKTYEWLWVVDPIDGTTNFVQGLPFVAISIAVVKRLSGTEKWTSPSRRWEFMVGVVCDPFRRETFSGALGLGAELKLRGALLGGNRPGVPIMAGDETLEYAVVGTGFAPKREAVLFITKGVAAVGLEARAVRMFGSAALMLAWVAAGRLSGFWQDDLNSWDVAAGVLLVREAGGVVTDLDGDDFELTTRSIIASTQFAHEKLQATLAKAAGTTAAKETTVSQAAAVDKAAPSPPKRASAATKKKSDPPPKCDEEGTSGKGKGTTGKGTTGKGKGKGRGRQLSIAAAEAEEDAWHEAWSNRVECWWLSLPMPTQQQLGQCMGAFSLSLGSRLDTLIGRAPGSSAGKLSVAEPGCEWLEEGGLFELPDLPEISSFEMSLPALPRLLPSWERLRWLQSGTDADNTIVQLQQRKWTPVAASFAGGAGTALAAVFVAMRLARQPSRTSVRRTRRQIDKAAAAASTNAMSS